MLHPQFDLAQSVISEDRCFCCSPILTASFLIASSMSSTIAPVRDLVAEATYKKRKPEPPLEEPSVEQLLSSTQASSTLVSPQAFIVTIDDEFADKVVEEALAGDEAMAVSLSAVPGVYWLLPWNIGMKPCWKQEQPAGGNDQPLVFFFHTDPDAGGWYCSSIYFETKKDRDAVEKHPGSPSIHMWMGSGDLPLEHPHCPFWAKKKCMGITVQPYVAWLLHENAKLTEKLSMSYVPSPVPAALMGNQGPTKRGGFMPKMVAAISLFYKKDWGNLKSLLDSIYQDSYNRGTELHQLVNANLNRSTQNR